MPLKIKHPGALHRQLGIPKEQKIPIPVLKLAKKSGNKILSKRANFE